ncbi:MULTISPECIES: ubiquinol oxidase subunit II [Mesorhizobium]|uniref:Ubiquinol oxidase polypeptide II n=3 Tax=Mesorhizobium TaxID=68287 RepID=A0AB38TK18_9HYPH|nr:MULTISPECIES: ubiquinol oxidase subunit II [Mesorhizobium]MDF3218412.1 ubiquinol oxidase subunit II [Mesorhizobium ciceri]RUY65440.1 ubiquinol oxidase subunit II [Mesorhizobium sp. M7A.F.Ca.CA.001.13.1.1]RUY68126.1 ubiquinol oxidase subunit II [Mesorhizobium sp. M7A.F.Ca.CA.001.05.1.1]RUZ22050.1 ubiquinol oxidase subunit II [Mesorhizobium sp. M7A.F.Ca.CA.001.09.1.1]RUZ36854.1 ubiquinol oxidase subunit II [Mesorhizobium sp. M7A.F.Ca.CA.001.15.1.1]
MRSAKSACPKNASSPGLVAEQVLLRSSSKPGRRLLWIPAIAFLPGCAGGVLDPQGPIGSGNRTILLNSLAVMLVIVVPTLVALLAFAWKFRASNSDARYDPEFTYSGRIELIVWSIPTLTILFLGGLIYYGSHQLDPRKPIPSAQPPLDIQVVALDWKWLFLYPEQGVGAVNQLVIPAGVPVHFKLTSASVMNTFFVPQLGSMVYVMNGMQTELHLQADREGSFFGQSAHFSGDGFSDMNFSVSAVSADAFTRWTSSLRGGGGVLNANAYRELARQSTNVPPSTFGHVQPGLFDAVAQQILPPGPGPAESAAGGEPQVSPKALPAAAPPTGHHPQAEGAE